MENKTIAPGSKEAFLNHAKNGFPRPLFAAEERLRKLLKRQYAELIHELLSDFMRYAKNAGITPDVLTVDSDGKDGGTPDGVAAFLEQLQESDRQAKDAQDKAKLKAALDNARINCGAKWRKRKEPDTSIQPLLFDVLLESQKNFMKKLGTQSNGALSNVIASFSVDKQKLYNDNMDNIRALYLDNTMERIQGEEDILKKRLLEKIAAYVSGKSDTLDLKEVTGQMLSSSSRMARFFARDQLARLNKATTISTFLNAGVTKVKWVTSHDVRVRQSHKDLDGQIFSIDNLPDEVDDYNCRCALVPAEYAD